MGYFCCFPKRGRVNEQNSKAQQNSNGGMSSHQDDSLNDSLDVSKLGQGKSAGATYDSDVLRIQAADLSVKPPGIPLHELESFIDVTGEQELQGLTTAEVCSKFILPATEDNAVSWCEAKGIEAEANIFVSHAWKYQFLDVVEAIRNHLSHSNLAMTSSVTSSSTTVQLPQTDSNPILFFDLFCNNQHKAPANGFDWWHKTFKLAIRSIGRTVLVLSPWRHPIPLQRVWCIFEIFCSIEAGINLEIAMSEREEHVFLEDMVEDEGAYHSMLASIDVKIAEATNLQDKERIFQVIENGPGFSGVNSSVLAELRAWVVRTAEQRAEERGLPLELKVQRSRIAVHLLSRQGKSNEALARIKSLFHECKECLSEKHEVTLSCQSLYAEQLMFTNQKNGLDVAKDCWEKSKDLFGDKHKETLRTMDIYGQALSRFGFEADGEKVLEECWDQRCQVFGDSDPFTLMSLNSLANFYSYHMKGKKMQRALHLHLQCLEKRKTFLGHSHPQTLQSKANLACVFENLGKFRQASLLHSAVLKVRREKLGFSHPSTITSQFKLGLAIVKSLNEAPEGEQLIDISEEGMFFEPTLSNAKCLMAQSIFHLQREVNSTGSETLGHKFGTLSAWKKKFKNLFDEDWSPILVASC